MCSNLPLSNTPGNCVQITLIQLLLMSYLYKYLIENLCMSLKFTNLDYMKSKVCDSFSQLLATEIAVETCEKERVVMLQASYKGVRRYLLFGIDKWVEEIVQSAISDSHCLCSI